MFNDRFEVINNTNTTYLAHTLPWARCRGVGARIGVHPPPLSSKIKHFFCYMGGLLASFCPWWGLFGTFLYLWGCLFHHVRAFLLRFSMWGPFLLRFSTLGSPFHHICELGPFCSLGFSQCVGAGMDIND